MPTLSDTAREALRGAYASKGPHRGQHREALERLGVW